jgi:large subunit ribosomal protein L15
MPLQRRLPKRGFRPVSRVAYEIVNLDQLAATFPAGSTVDVDELRRRRLVHAGRLVKCLADGALGHALTVRLNAFSKQARERITAAGGTVEVLGA